MREARNVVQQYGGMFQPAMGDGVLIVFGAPIAQEDHAVRAALAALELRQQLNEWLTCSGGKDRHNARSTTLVCTPDS